MPDAAAPAREPFRITQIPHVGAIEIAEMLYEMHPARETERVPFDRMPEAMKRRYYEAGGKIVDRIQLYLLRVEMALKELA
jgi:hypothetical protein